MTASVIGSASVALGIFRQGEPQQLFPILRQSAGYRPVDQFHLLLVEPNDDPVPLRISGKHGHLFLYTQNSVSVSMISNSHLYSVARFHGNQRLTLG
jgi:hypothetical protein